MDTSQGYYEYQIRNENAFNCENNYYAYVKHHYGKAFLYKHLNISLS